MHFQGYSSLSSNTVPSRFVLAGTERRYERPKPFQLLHQALDILLLIEQASIEATATLRFKRVDKTATRLSLDAIGFEIESVSLISQDEEHIANFDYDGNELSIAVPLEVEQAEVAIEYRVTPRRGLYFLAPDEAVPTRPRQVWSQCQDEDARY